MLNEKQSPSSASDRSLKAISRDVVIPSLNSPGDFTNDSSVKKTMANSADDGQNSGETRSRDIHTNCVRDQSSESRGQSSQSRDQSNKSRDHSSGSHENSNAREHHAVVTHKANDTDAHDTNVCDEADTNMGKTGSSNTRENKCQTRASTRVSRTRDSITRHPRDIGTCLNTLDYLKAVLQSSMVGPWVVDCCYRPMRRQKCSPLNSKTIYIFWLLHLQKTWLGNNVSWFVHLQETWLGNNVSWFVHL